MNRITPLTALKRNRHARRRTLADNLPAPLVDPVTPAANGDRLTPSALSSSMMRTTRSGSSTMTLSVISSSKQWAGKPLLASTLLTQCTKSVR